MMRLRKEKSCQINLTDTNYNNASHDQETMLNKIEPKGDGSLAFEILFDG